MGSAGTPWSVTPAVHYSAYFQGIMLATIMSHLNVIFFHIYSKIAAVFLTMALLFRCLLAYRLKKKANVPPKVYGGYAHASVTQC